MLLAYTPDCDKVIQRVLIRRVVTPPSDHIKYRVVHLGLEVMAHELIDDSEAGIPFVLLILISSDRVLEIFRIRKTVCADGSKPW